MMSNIESTYENNLALAGNIFEYNRNQEEFGEKVECFDPNALQTYIVLMSHFGKQNQEIPSNLLTLITPNQFYKKLNESTKLLDDNKHLSKYLVDAFQVMVTATKCIETENFYTDYNSALKTALNNEHSNVISVYLQILYRLDRIFSTTEIPVEMFETPLNYVHGRITDLKLLNELLLLIESNMMKRHNLTGKTPATEKLLNFMWHNLCSSRVAKHQCSICYTIISQLINVYLIACKLDETFCKQFLSGELWHFMRAAIESKETVQRKQAIYILQNILLTNEKEVMSTDESNDYVKTDLQNIWKNYFAILESLLEIQCHLILSCLDQYLDGIVKQLPPFWYSIVFALVLKHHNNVVIHYGIEFILRHGISLHHDSHLMNGFYQALNNTYLHSEAKISEQDLAKYFQDSDMNHTLDIMMLISWQPVPLWTVIKSIDFYVEKNQGNGFQIGLLLEFLKRSVRVIKTMPEVGDMTVRILQNCSNNKLTLEQVLGLYNVIPRIEILDTIQEPLDLQRFEMNFIQLNQISIETKINYFQRAIPNIKDQSKLLDEFYEKNRTMIYYFPHYEYLLFNNLCIEKPLKDALFVIKPRIYNLMKPHGNVSLDALYFSASLLKFIVDKFTGDCVDPTTFDTINKTLTNFHDVIRKKIYVDNDSNTLRKLQERLTTISMKLTKCIDLYPKRMAVVGVLSEVMMLEDEDIDLVRQTLNKELFLLNFSFTILKIYFN